MNCWESKPYDCGMTISSQGWVEISIKVQRLSKAFKIFS
nr:MAG TPA: hypothetical protein [Caudoviricetes sp.]